MIKLATAAATATKREHFSQAQARQFQQGSPLIPSSLFTGVVQSGLNEIEMHTIPQMSPILEEDYGVDVNSPLPGTGNTPLTEAIWQGNTALMDKLMQNKSTDLTKASSITGLTPLMAAMIKHNLPAAKSLLAAGVPINTATYKVSIAGSSKGDLYSAALLAIEHGFNEGLELLLKREDFHINEQTGTQRISPLFFALAIGNTAAAKLLLTSKKHKVDVNSQTSTGLTPLQVVVQEGYREIVKLIFSKFKVDVFSGKSKHGSALEMAQKKEDGGKSEMKNVLTKYLHEHFSFVPGSKITECLDGRTIPFPSNLDQVKGLESLKKLQAKLPTIESMRFMDRDPDSAENQKKVCLAHISEDGKTVIFSLHNEDEFEKTAFSGHKCPYTKKSMSNILSFSSSNFRDKAYVLEEGFCASLEDLLSR